MSMYYLNPATGKYELQGAPHVDAYSKEQTDALIAAIPKGVEMELLWENASPTSNFSGQGVVIGSGYNLVFVEDTQGNVAVLAGYNEPIMLSFYYGEGKAFRMYSRWTGYKDSALYFGDALIISSFSASTYSPDNSKCIPYKIYGIKGVKENV